MRGLIYPVPDPRLPFLGVHLSRHVDDEVLIGPTALMVGARDAYRLGRSAPATSRRPCLAGHVADGAALVAHRASRARRAASRRALVAAAARYVPELTPPTCAGDRRRARPGGGARRKPGRRLRLRPTGRTLHVRNAPSPAATSSLAIAEHIADELDGDRS